jgi:hypothetical protein
MNGDRFPYDEWVNLALQGVLHRALTTLATQGFSGDHHLFISFDTNHPDVRMPGFLRAQYPDEITIVLQHQFDDLEVADDVFQVSLSFNGQKHRLNVPFAAVRSFADPSVHFGLQINQAATAAVPPTTSPRARNGGLPEIRPERSENNVDHGHDFRAKPPAEESEEVAQVKTAGSGNREHPAPTPGSAEVITLDAFRKK